MQQQNLILFNGSHLGSYSFDSVVKWCSPVDTNSQRLIPSLRAILYLNEEYHSVILKKNPTKFRTQCFVDELKPLFGLRKIGTNTIELDGVVRKKNKDYPWICSNSNLTYDSFGYPILQSETDVLRDYFTHDMNLYIHKMKTMYYVFAVATYNVKLMYANEINSYTTALSSHSSPPSSSSNDDDNNENDNNEDVEEKNREFIRPAPKEYDLISNFYPILPVKKCCWFSGAPGPWSKLPKGKKKKDQYIETPTDDQQMLYYEIQKIFIFRNLLDINFIYNKDCIFSPRRSFESESENTKLGFVPISINEFRFRNPNAKGRKNMTAEEKFYFPEPTIYYQILNIMIAKVVLEDHDVTDLTEICNIFADKLYTLARTQFRDELYICNKIIEKITNAFIIYNNIMLSKF